MSIIGEPISRVDGKLKVTGGAKYAAEFPAAQVCYAAMVMSRIPSGRLTRIDASDARNSPGVIAALTPDNAPKLPGAKRRITVLQDNEVFYNNQPIALVVADTLEQAHYGASLVHVSYASQPAKLNFEAGFPEGVPGSHNGIPGDLSWGDVNAGLARAEIKIDQVYTTPIQHHNPMEPHATMAQWDGDHLTIHDATQHVTGVQETLAQTFGIPKTNVHVICPFVGGGLDARVSNGPM
jgi:xanthine dehydrogenase YagR molybdenum-binding subunit